MATNYLEQTLTADGDSDVCEWNGAVMGHFAAYGDFGSGTAKLQYSLDGSTYKDVDATNLSFTADGNGNFELPTCKVRVNLNGSTDPDLDLVIRPVYSQSR